MRVTNMISPEGEDVQFQNEINVGGDISVENW